MKKVISALLVALLLLSALSACAGQGSQPKTYRLTHETKFGGVYFDITIEDFNARGFTYGDSVDIVFSNGKTLSDLPYYNGYYVDMGEPLLVAYPGYPFIKAGINYGDDLWVLYELDETCTATISLHEKAKYLSTQMARDIHYSDEQGDKSDAVFGNFRVVNMGSLKENILYRGASPCNNEHNRAAVVDRLAEAAGIAFIINLSDTDEDVAGFLAAEDFHSPYFRSLYEAGNVVALGLSANFRAAAAGENDNAPLGVLKDAAFSEKLARGLAAAAEHEGPFLVHCVEGKDRTGYVMMLLEALAGATYREIIDDYMVTYDNYYGINPTSDPERYQVIKEKNVDEMIAYMTGMDAKADFTTVDLAHYARQLLVQMGMTEEQVDLLKSKIANIG